jgi:hypothetical protein
VATASRYFQEVLTMDIDLFGNSIEQKSLTTMQRLSSRQEMRTGSDLYTTDQKDIERFIKAINMDGVKLLEPIWEPAAGKGDMSKMLIKHGYDVLSTDIFPYKDHEIEIGGLDFFICDRVIGMSKTIFTNPPFNMQEAFLEHALSMGIDVVFFVRLSFLAGIRRLKLYKKYNPYYVYVYSARAHCYKNGDIDKEQNMIDYCVILWKPPYRNETILRWIA